MSNTAIAVRNLSKRYTIGHQANSGDGLRHAFDEALRNPLGWLRKRNRARREAREDFWALKDVSFDIQHGDAVAIIGRNGAGKSTLLKILSRITEPTEGRIDLYGRVASLLEVGTGFHQELTGRENIFLNGAILGMTRAEITRKFDEIVAFSEIEKFLDTPVKRYSSGMYVRLAFAVAAHLEPEILIVDEVLAVGDAAFQKKCLGKMGEVAHGGRTVLFVSHNMPAVQALCKRAVLLQAGSLKAVGAVDPLVQQYLAQGAEAAPHHFRTPVTLSEQVKLVDLEFTPNPVQSGAPVRFRLAIRADAVARINELALTITSSQGTRVAILDLRAFGLPATISDGAHFHLAGEIKPLPLLESDYGVGLYFSSPGVSENFADLCTLSVAARPGRTGLAPFATHYRGVVDLDFTADFRVLSRDHANSLPPTDLVTLEPR